jgi:hypothetical protein
MTAARNMRLLISTEFFITVRFGRSHGSWEPAAGIEKQVAKIAENNIMWPAVATNQFDQFVSQPLYAKQRGRKFRQADAQTATYFSTARCKPPRSCRQSSLNPVLHDDMAVQFVGGSLRFTRKSYSLQSAKTLAHSAPFPGITAK